MPNHCSNILRIYGPLARVSEFVEFAKGTGPAWDGRPKTVELYLDLHKFIPAPADAIADYSNVGYKWCNKNWGTKWGCYDTELNGPYKAKIGVVHQYGIEYRFQTAWAPFSKEVLEAMSAKFPTLEFELKYGEAGMNFAGIMWANKGEATDNYQNDATRLAGLDADIHYCMEHSG